MPLPFFFFLRSGASSSLPSSSLLSRRPSHSFDSGAVRRSSGAGSTLRWALSDTGWISSESTTANASMRATPSPGVSASAANVMSRIVFSWQPRSRTSRCRLLQNGATLVLIFSPSRCRDAVIGTGDDLGISGSTYIPSSCS